jgi:hypothetical protein
MEAGFRLDISSWYFTVSSYVLYRRISLLTVSLSRSAHVQDDKFFPPMSGMECLYKVDCMLGPVSYSNIDPGKSYSSPILSPASPSSLANPSLASFYRLPGRGGALMHVAESDIGQAIRLTELAVRRHILFWPSCAVVICCHYIQT